MKKRKQKKSKNEYIKRKWIRQKEKQVTSCILLIWWTQNVIQKVRKKQKYVFKYMKNLKIYYIYKNKIITKI